MKLAETPSKYKKNEDVFSRRAPQSVETKDKLALANVAYNYNIGSFYPWNAFVVSQKHTVKWLENCYREPIGSFKFENTFEVVFNFGIWIQNELKNTSRDKFFFLIPRFWKDFLVLYSLHIMIKNETVIYHFDQSVLCYV